MWPLMNPSYLLVQELPDVVSGVFGALSEAIFGIILILVILGYLWPKPSVESLKKEIERLQASVENKDQQLVDLRGSIEENVIPSIEKNAHVAERVVALLESNKDYSRKVAEAIERINDK